MLVKRESGTVRQASVVLPRALATLAALFGITLPSMALSQQSAQKPTLVVFFTIDQMRPDYLPRFDKQLTGGLARLYRNCAVFDNAYQDHAITETAPGHSATLSGRFPRSTSITTNTLGVQDDHAPLLSGAGPGA